MIPTVSTASNRILSALPEQERRVVDAHCEECDMKSGAVIYEVDERLRHVYFPLDSVMSMLSVMENGAAVEVGSVGREGMAGVQMVLGSDQIPGRGICQVPGRALRLPRDAFTELLANNQTFRTLLQRYTLAVFSVAAQSVACNRLHPLAERCARWLLMTQDRVGKDDFSLTHEFLAMMLGVRRPGVSTAAAMLQSAGFIRYARGHVTIIDRLGLQSASCECYRVTVQEYERLMQVPILARSHN